MFLAHIHKRIGFPLLLFYRDHREDKPGLRKCSRSKLRSLVKLSLGWQNNFYESLFEEANRGTEAFNKNTDCRMVWWCELIIPRSHSYLVSCLASVVGDDQPWRWAVLSPRTDEVSVRPVIPCTPSLPCLLAACSLPARCSP